MPKSNLPTYAIVELLIRLEKHNPAIGGYKNHTEFDMGVIVKTSGGSIEFPKELVEQQFHAPEKITEKELVQTALLFKN
jgi:hypothetical protein